MPVTGGNDVLASSGGGSGNAYMGGSILMNRGAKILTNGNVSAGYTTDRDDEKAINNPANMIARFDQRFGAQPAKNA
jgi:hypothetical protein